MVVNVGGDVVLADLAPPLRVWMATTVGAARGTQAAFVRLGRARWAELSAEPAPDAVGEAGATLRGGLYAPPGRLTCRLE